MSERRMQLIQILPGINDIKEINSVVVKLSANTKSDLMSKSLAKFLGCKVTRKNDADKLDLIGKTPNFVYGTTQVMLRLPTLHGEYQAHL